MYKKSGDLFNIMTGWLINMSFARKQTFFDEKVSIGDILIDTETKEEYSVFVDFCYNVGIYPAGSSPFYDNTRWYETGLGEQKYGKHILKMKLSLNRFCNQFDSKFKIKIPTKI